MSRVKTAKITRKKHKKVLKMAKGYYGAKSTRFRMAKQAVMKSLQYAYVGRKLRKRDFRRLWIARINAAARLNGLSYNKLMYGLKLCNVEVNRKMLADLAVNNVNEFKALCDLAKKPVDKHYSEIKANQLKAHQEAVAAETARKEAVAKARAERMADR